MSRKLKPGTLADAYVISDCLRDLRRVRKELLQAGATVAAAKVARAIASTDGAHRHAMRRWRSTSAAEGATANASARWMDGGERDGCKILVRDTNPLTGRPLGHLDVAIIGSDGETVAIFPSDPENMTAGGKVDQFFKQRSRLRRPNAE